jgi:hypothetical protein
MKRPRHAPIMPESDRSFWITAIILVAIFAFVLGFLTHEAWGLAS